jgi:hypothetical protein
VVTVPPFTMPRLWQAVQLTEVAERRTSNFRLRALSLPRHRLGGALVDVRYSETRDMAAAIAFFRSAQTATGFTPARGTTVWHESYPRQTRTVLCAGVNTGSIAT